MRKLRISREIDGLAEKPWGGRFETHTDRRVERFTESITLDRRLFEHDIRGSIAHARMLAEVGLLSTDECERIVRGLTEIQAEIENGTFVFDIAREDIHMHVESALIDRLGDIGRKLHTARSRNDQVSTDLRMWIRDGIDRIHARLVDLQAAFVEAAIGHRDVILPGYTHLQRAQPILASHYFLAYIEKFDRDCDRALDCRKRVNVSPLGSAALAGTTLPIDRSISARLLGFDSVSANSLDSSSDRDFAVESVFVLTLIAEHLAGWAEEWVIWSTKEFGFLKLPDALCTGSSIMPQKKNPDVLELIRGRSARVVGALSTLLVLIKGLPLAYNRDLQEDKAPVFDAFDTVESCLELAAVLVRDARLNREIIASRLDEGYLDATTLMEALIERGIPQRAAHEVVGKLVATCERRGVRLVDLDDSEFRAAHPGLDGSIKTRLGVASAIAAFRSEGSTAPAEVDRRLQYWSERLGVVSHEDPNTNKVL